MTRTGEAARLREEMDTLRFHRAILILVGANWGNAYLLPWLSNHVDLFFVISQG